MAGAGAIDVTFDFRTDTPPGKDPDAHSPTLRRYHQLLWSKPLPCGVVFQLDHRVSPGSAYLRHSSELGEFWLASDAVVPTFRYTPFREQIPPAEFEWFCHLDYTIGGMMLFPRNRVDGKMTINGARGFDRKIRDRFDLTLECIRRHYLGERSPLSAVLARYADFFALFGDFGGYVEFFHLRDLTTPDGSQVRFMTPFDDFQESPVPATLGDYLAYRDHAVEFLQARNHRIATLT